MLPWRLRDLRAMSGIAEIADIRASWFDSEWAYLRLLAATDCRSALLWGTDLTCFDGLVWLGPNAEGLGSELAHDLR